MASLFSMSHQNTMVITIFTFQKITAQARNEILTKIYYNENKSYPVLPELA